MKIEIELIEELTSEQLRKLPLASKEELPDVYSDGGADELQDDDEISMEECGFMEGYLAY